MDFGIIDILLQWIRANPAWAGAAVMLIAFGESLALVGLFLPGAVLMFGVGALVGGGLLPLWPTLAWAAAGAIAGDGVSFWLGRHFHQRIRVMWPLRRHPELLARSVDFFHRHGGKSVLLGRFIGPIRPVIPVVAGMLEMPTRRFIVVNVISGLLWAPVYVLPGMVFAASLGLAAEVATRLALLLGTVLMLLFLVLWLTRRLFNLYHRHAHRLLRYTLGWTQRHPHLGHLPAALLDPSHPEARGLTLLGLLLFLAGAILLWGVQTLGGGALPDLDQEVRNVLQAWRTPWADRALLPVAALAGSTTLLPLFAAVLLWLLWRRHWQAATHWLAAALFAALFSLLHLLPPLSTAALYGFLAVLLGREASEYRRWLTYAAAALLLSLSGFAQLYLDIQPLSAVVIGTSLGLLWASLLGIAWLHRPAGRLAPRPLLAVALCSMLATGLWQRLEPADMERTAAGREVQWMDAVQWQRQGWAELPAERNDVRQHRNQPLPLQYAGTLPRLQQALEAQGWQPPVTLTPLSSLQWLNLETEPAHLPILPQVHDGRHQSLLLIKPEPDGRRLRVLRLWSSERRLQPGDVPLWIGNTAWLEVRRVLGTFAVPHTLGDFSTPLELLRGDLDAAGWHAQVVRRTDGTATILVRQD